MSQKTEIDLSKLSLGELKELRPQIEERIAELEEQKRLEILAKIEKLAESIGETPESLVKKRKAKARRAESGAAGATGPYRHPESGETWSGRGRRPQWVTDHLEAGGKLEDLAG